MKHKYIFQERNRIIVIFHFENIDGEGYDETSIMSQLRKEMSTSFTSVSSHTPYFQHSQSKLTGLILQNISLYMSITHKEIENTTRCKAVFFYQTSSTEIFIINYHEFPVYIIFPLRHFNQDFLYQILKICQHHHLLPNFSFYFAENLQRRFDHKLIHLFRHNQRFTGFCGMNFYVVWNFIHFLFDKSRKYN